MFAYFLFLHYICIIAFSMQHNPNKTDTMPLFVYTYM